MTEQTKEQTVQTIEPDSIELIKFCPICGDKMHKETMYDQLWWVCDDPECGFAEWVD